MEGVAVKFDQGKPRYDLLPGDALNDIVEVFTHGADKYGERNWEKGLSWGRLFGATMRHMWAWWRGEEIDPDSGLSHLSHAAASVIMLAASSRRRIGEDSRNIHE
jgi:hypothetical protein